MNKTERKHEAQEHLMHGLRAAFAMADDIDDETRVEMSKQMARIEKLFGYEPFSSPRGV